MSFRVFSLKKKNPRSGQSVAIHLVVIFLLVYFNLDSFLGLLSFVSFDGFMLDALWTITSFE